MTSFTDRVGLEVMTTAECDHLLATTAIGRIGFIADGDVVILPINFQFVGGTVVFRTGTGSKLSAALMHRPVAFEIDSFDVSLHSGWSVLVKGVVSEITDPAELASIATTNLKPWVDTVDRDRWVRIRPDEITGRKIA